MSREILLSTVLGCAVEYTAIDDVHVMLHVLVISDTELWSTERSVTKHCLTFYNMESIEEQNSTVNSNYCGIWKFVSFYKAKCIGTYFVPVGIQILLL